MNIKAVDSYSGYVKMELIHDKTANTTTDFIKRFHTRSERQTGKILKAVCTDSGNEFNGMFVGYLEEFGITKRKGHGYDHHFPPDAENANKIHPFLLQPQHQVQGEKGIDKSEAQAIRQQEGELVY